MSPVRGHVLQRAEDGASSGQRLARGDRCREAVRADRPRRPELRQPEVQELGPRLRQHDVARLQISMRNALSVRFVQGVGDLGGVPQHLSGREWPLGQPCGQRVAFQVLHHQEGDPVPLTPALSPRRGRLIPDIVERANVRVVQAGDGLRLALEPLQEVGVTGDMLGQDLDGDRAVQPRVAGLVDLSPSRPRRWARGSRTGRAWCRLSATSWPRNRPIIRER